MLGTPSASQCTSLAVIVPVAIVGAGILGGGHQVDLEVASRSRSGRWRCGARRPPERRLSDWFFGGRRHHGLAVAIVMIADAVLRAWRQRAPDRRSHPSGISLWIMALVWAPRRRAEWLLGIGAAP